MLQSDVVLQVSEFIESARPLLQRPASEASEVGIVITPWLGTAVPWFSMALALLYRERGWPVTLIWDDMPCDDELANDAENRVVAQVMPMFEGLVRVVCLSAFGEHALTDEDAAQIRRLAAANAKRQLLGQVRSASYSASYHRFEARFWTNLARIKTLLRGTAFDHLVVPGGVYANSGLYLWEGQNLGVRVASFDSGEGLLLIGTDQPAAHFMDIAKLDTRKVELFASPDQKRRALALVQSEFQLRREGKAIDRFTSQVEAYSKTSVPDSFDVLIPLNLDWDTAALNKPGCFHDTLDWVVKTVGFLLEHTDATIVVRQHPSDRFFESGENVFKLILEENFGEIPRLRFVACDEPVNTYRLMEQARLVLPHTSTAGVEAAILGKRVITFCDVYYAGLGFVGAASSQAEYFGAIVRALEIGGGLEPDQVEAAWICYFLSQSCNWLQTVFTPDPADFQQWVRRGFQSLVSDEVVADVVSALSTGRPMALFAKDRLLTTASAGIGHPMPQADSLPLEAQFPTVTFGNDVQVIGMSNVIIGEGSCVGDNSWLNVCIRDDALRMVIGRRVLMGRQSMISTGGFLEIGDYCVLAPRVYISDADHIFADIRHPILQQGATLGRSITIEENCWFGINTVASGNLTVGRGSVVAANSVVLVDVPPFAVVAGNPARIIKLYNPVTKTWERVRTAADRERVMAAREQHGLPSRLEYRQILRDNAKFRQVDPLVAGRALSI